jgi:chaperone required for assembly of F1-ATPase
VSTRFWTAARVVAAEGGFGVALDGKPVRLPGGAVLAMRSAALARAVAAEWQELGGNFGPADVPLTGLAGTAQERVRPNRAGMVASLSGYAAADLLCYRAAHPARLAEAQAAAWQPWLDWAERDYGARLGVTTGLRAIDQPPESLAALGAALAALSDEDLAALGLAVPALGSCVLGLALSAGALAPAEAFRLSVLDERVPEARWDEDREAAARRAGLLRDIELAARFMELCRNDSGGHARAH